MIQDQEPSQKRQLRLYKTSAFTILSQSSVIPTPTESPKTKPFRIFFDVNCPYTQTLVIPHLKKRNIPHTLGLGHGDDAISPLNSTDIEKTDIPTFQWSEYERIDWDAVHDDKRVMGASSYRIRKGIARKAQLCIHTEAYVERHPTSVLKRSMPDTIVIETWSLFENKGGNMNMGFGERLDMCLALAGRCFRDAEEEWTHSPRYKNEPAPVWILKPSTINKGEGIQIVQCLEQIKETLLDLTDIREWVMQRYITSPLLLQNRKFHIRAYVLAVSDIQVYFYDEVLFLRTMCAYDGGDFSNRGIHLTNTAVQADTKPAGGGFREEECVLLKETVARILVEDGACPTLFDARRRLDKMLQDMHDITRDLFLCYKNQSAAGNMGVFEPIEGCFEHFGLDFMVDERDWGVYLLEINPGPDFKQTGDALKDVVGGLMGDTIDVALLGKDVENTKFTKVCDWDGGKQGECFGGI